MVEVKTFEDARKLTLKKWNKVIKNIEKLGESEQCGFCFLSVELALDNLDKVDMPHSKKCYYCPVKKKCRDMNKASMNYLYEYLGEVNNLVRWLDTLKENDVKSKYQLKGGE